MFYAYSRAFREVIATDYRSTRDNYLPTYFVPVNSHDARRLIRGAIPVDNSPRNGNARLFIYRVSRRLPE